MKRLWLILSLMMVLVPSGINAKGGVKPFRLGVEAGMDLNKMSISSNMFKTENRTGWFLGPKMDVSIPIGKLGLDASLLYNKKLISSYQISETQNLSYVVIPVNLHYHFRLVPGASVYVATGPQWNWYIGNSHKLDELQSTYILEGAEYTEYAVLNHTYMSWNVGAGVELLNHFQLGMTYSIGIDESMESVTDGATRALRNAFSGRNRSFLVRAAVLF